jgi:hypothetical protein
MDDVVVGDDPIGARPQAGRGLQRWLELAAGLTTSSACRTTSRCPSTATAWCRPRGRRSNLMGTEVEPLLPGGCGALRPRGRRRPRAGDRARHGHARRRPARRVHRAVPGAAARRDRRGRPGARLLPLVAARQLRVDLRLRLPVRAARGRPQTFVRTAKPSAGVYAAIVRAGAVSA